MKNILTLLVEDDIKQARLIRTLRLLDIDARSLLTNTSSVIFELLNLKNSNSYEDLLDIYFQKIEEAGDDKNNNDSKHIETITDWLTSQTNSKKAKKKTKKI